MVDIRNPSTLIKPRCPVVPACTLEAPYEDSQNQLYCACPELCDPSAASNQTTQSHPAQVPAWYSTSGTAEM